GLVALGRVEQLAVITVKDLVHAERARLAVDRREAAPEAGGYEALRLRELGSRHAAASDPLELRGERRLGRGRIAAGRQRQEEPREPRVEALLPVAVDRDGDPLLLDERAV